MRRLCWLALLAGCGAPEPKPEAITPPETVAQPLTDAPAPKAGWDCAVLTPPVGYLQETRHVDAGPGALERAGEQAKSDLLKRICSEGDCNRLRSAVSLWKTGSGGGQLCAMAVVEAAEVERYRKDVLSSGRLDDELKQAAQALLPADPPPVGPQAKGKAPPVVLINRLVDNGVPGGDRVRWLLPRLRRALGQTGAVLAEAEPQWTGQGVPKGIDAVIDGTLTERREEGRSVVELVLEARRRHKTSVVVAAAPPVFFPAIVAPPGGMPKPLAPLAEPGLSLRLSSQEGGGICAGAKSGLLLTSNTAVFARVFDLYGNDGAVLLFPDANHPSGKVAAGETIAIGGTEGFEAVPFPGSDAERFLVIATESEADLGPFAGARTPCRLNAARAAALHRFEGLPPLARVATDGFRILTGGECKPISPEEQARLAEALNSMESCP